MEILETNRNVWSTDVKTCHLKNNCKETRRGVLQAKDYRRLKEGL